MVKRNLAILFLCQMFTVSGNIVLVTIGGIVGTELAANPALATLPLSLLVIGVALTTVPAAIIMKRIGRRLGFVAAALWGALGALLAAYALLRSSFELFCLAAVMFGMNVAFVQQYRFAAAESVPATWVSRAISLVLLGSIGGALLGPALATEARDWVAGGEYVGTMLAASGLLLLAALLLLALKDQPLAPAATAAAAAPRRLRQVVRQPIYVVAVMGGVVGYAVMTFIMTATPVSMHVIDGHSIERTAGVIRSHVIAMYAPALFSGFLIERLGVSRMMFAGTLVMLATVLTGLQGHQVMHYWVALVLLGVGWNFLYIGGTTLLTRAYRASERHKSQAVNDFSVFGASALASLMAGTVIHVLGWTALMLIVLLPLAAMLVALLSVRGRPELGGTASITS